MKIIETKKLYKDYYIKKIVVNALRGIDFSLEDGEFTAIAGPSGSGKSTLLHLIGLLDIPTKGNIYIEGKDASKLSKNRLAMLRREKLGFIFQAYNLIPVLTAFENVAFPLTLLGYNRDEIKKISYNVLGSVGLKGMENRRPIEMSGGQQQRVAIARALAKKPKLILADEPTANLDSKTGKEILEIMRKLNKTEKITFLFSTHDKMVMDYAKRLVIIRDGKITEEENK
jgi:putative ABC transport system ATP-binding protein